MCGGVKAECGRVWAASRSGEEAGEGVKDLRVRNVCGDFGPEFNAVLDPCMANAMWLFATGRSAPAGTACSHALRWRQL